MMTSNGAGALHVDVETLRRSCRSAVLPLCASAAMLLVSGSVDAQAISSDEIFIIGNSLESIRRSALRDPSRVDFCAVDAFWDSRSGASLLMNAETISTRQDRRVCPPRIDRTIYVPDVVVVNSMTVYGDSIVLRGSTMRGERMLMAESYLLRRGAGRGGLEYRMTLLKVVD